MSDNAKVEALKFALKLIAKEADQSMRSGAARDWVEGIEAHEAVIKNLIKRFGGTP